MFTNEDEDVVIVYDPIYPNVPWINTHVWALCRGKKLRDFFEETGRWILTETQFEVITCITPAKLRRQQIFLGTLGAQRRFEWEGDVLQTFDINDL